MQAHFLVTSLVIILLTPLLMILSFRVIRYRRKNRISLGHSDDRELLKRTRAHANFFEYTPFFLIQLALCEAQQANQSLLILIGLLFVSGRYMHAQGVSKTNFKLRVPGMICTFASIVMSTVTLVSILLRH